MQVVAMDSSAPPGKPLRVSGSARPSGLTARSPSQGGPALHGSRHQERLGVIISVPEGRALLVSPEALALQPAFHPLCNRRDELFDVVPRSSKALRSSGRPSRTRRWRRSSCVPRNSVFTALCEGDFSQDAASSDCTVAPLSWGRDRCSRVQSMTRA